MVKEIAELIVFYCSQYKTILADAHKMGRFYDTYFKITRNKNLRPPLMDHLLKRINMIKNAYEKVSPRFIMLYTCILHLDEELSTDSKLWKQLLCEMYDVYLRLCFGKE
jgi:hypothetical protein